MCVTGCHRCEENHEKEIQLEMNSGIFLPLQTGENKLLEFSCIWIYFFLHWIRSYEFHNFCVWRSLLYSNNAEGNILSTC